MAHFIAIGSIALAGNQGSLPGLIYTLFLSSFTSCCCYHTRKDWEWEKKKLIPDDDSHHHFTKSSFQLPCPKLSSKAIFMSGNNWCHRKRRRSRGNLILVLASVTPSEMACRAVWSYFARFSWVWPQQHSLKDQSRRKKIRRTRWKIICWCNGFDRVIRTQRKAASFKAVFCMIFLCCCCWCYDEIAKMSTGSRENWIKQKKKLLFFKKMKVEKERVFWSHDALFSVIFTTF